MPVIFGNAELEMKTDVEAASREWQQKSSALSAAVLINRCERKD